ncbi:hypothetical protein HYPSUDRAFT_422536 [Hypholoma sublateritium FD-334 SS-4]|uniref:Uncharacterized protein n=1 Tax=Hypholoma sublateritium (strain FD-334 SS-4) TaxID=945553 RepID=A0A0D2MMZ9_HYPSF|nr:hypothetical protein HYPSUDRAFT_422536 [Hypholoma sublateritium FD-334 SS-4]
MSLWEYRHTASYSWRVSYAHPRFIFGSHPLNCVASRIQYDCQDRCILIIGAILYPWCSCLRICPQGSLVPKGCMTEGLCQWHTLHY